MALPAERRQQIANIVKERKGVTCVELCRHFNVSPGTVRKDLETLEEQGCLQRTYGGAVLTEPVREKTVRFAEREVINAEIKDRIGARAAEMVCDGETVFIDASTTSLFVAKHLRGRRGLTVITNAERVVSTLCDEADIRVICTGGELRKSNLSYVGETAEALIRNGFYADKMFFSCCGISKKFGIFDAVESEANIKKAMFASAESVILLCDSSKFEKLGFPKLADFDMVQTVVTERQINGAWAEVFGERGIEVLTAR
ncbi:MAG: DeoR/GlpR family DNA-binding transcription regulator [Eubacteriales bacterium]|nr:DeoR/GlpR family DNA-binding transcription regulator [Eubacteriales bacterium]